MKNTRHPGRNPCEKALDHRIRAGVCVKKASDVTELTERDNRKETGGKRWKYP